MEKKDTLSSCSDSEIQQMQLIQDKSKESCMVSFQQLHSHLKCLSNNDLKGSRTEEGFKRAFATLFGQDLETFTGTMFLYMDQLQKQLDNEEFQEIGSMSAFKVLQTQFQMFIKSRFYLDDEYVDMTRNKFLQYTRLDIPEFRDTLIQHMESVKKSIGERAQHKMEYESRVNERQIQTTEEKTDTSNALDALDASSVIIESNGTESKEQDTSSRSGNDAHVDDADIRPIYNEEPMAKVQTTAEINVFAIGQQHTEQPELNNEGEVDQNAEQCHDTCPLPATLTDNQTTEFSNQSLESENIRNSVNTKFAKPSILGKLVGQPLKNQSVVRQPTAFKSERPRISKPRFASQVDVNNDLSKPVTTHHLPKGRESAPAKPHHMIAPSSSRPRSSMFKMMSDHNSSDLAPQRQEMSVERNFSQARSSRTKGADYYNYDPVPQTKMLVPTQKRQILTTRFKQERKLCHNTEMCKVRAHGEYCLNEDIKEAMADFAWIEAMQDELHQFDRLKSGNSLTNHWQDVIKLKCLWKNKEDERTDCNSQQSATCSLRYASEEGFDFEESFGTSCSLGRDGILLGLQIHQSPKGIFINQAKYALEILKKHNMDNCHSIGTPLATKPKPDVNLSGEPVDQSDYRSKIGSLMYLTSSRPDLVKAGTINKGLWYPKDSGFELTAFSDADHAGCIDTRKSTSRGI
ncbi:hypothetical protein Tco_0818984 [Tanacetum coccineum]